MAYPGSGQVGSIQSQEFRIKKMRKSGKELLVASQRTEREGLIFQKSIDGLLILTDPRLKPSE